MKQKFLFAFFTSSLLIYANEIEVSKYGYQSRILKKGDSISKFLYSNGMRSQKIIDETLKINNLNRNSAKKVPVGTKVWIPYHDVTSNQSYSLFSYQNNYSNKRKPNNSEMDSVETSDSGIEKHELNTVEDEMTNDENNFYQSNQIQATVGTFTADDRIHGKENSDINRQNNYQVNVAGEIMTNLDYLKSINISGYMDFYDEESSTGYDTDDERLSPSYGVAFSTEFNLINNLNLTPELSARFLNSYDLNNKNELKERFDTTGWVGLILSYNVFGLTPYVKYSHLNSAYGPSRRFDKLKASENKIGLDYSDQNFIAGIYWRYLDFNMDTKDFTRDLGLNIGYIF